MVAHSADLPPNKDTEEVDIIYNKNVSYIDLKKISTRSLHKQISALKLEFCNITAYQVEVLSKLLADSETIMEVSVNGNPNDKQNFYLLLHKTNIITLSLKFCGINSEGIEKISDELYSPCGNNLLHLNLSSNSIESEGVKHIARFLRINRTLISLNLADNKIYDMGCLELMIPLEKFFLNFEETVIRRRIKFDTQKRNMIRRGELSSKNILLCKEVSTSFGLVNHPFMEDNNDDEDIYCKGNDILINLNLSYNRITEWGLSAIIKILFYQRNYCACDRGLSRISVEGNDFYNGAEITKKLNEILAVKSKKISGTVSKSKNVSSRKRS